MRILGPPIYEWFSHNFFVAAVAIGTVAVMVYFLYAANKKKGRYR
jgi:hypothetical protein